MDKGAHQALIERATKPFWRSKRFWTTALGVAAIVVPAVSAHGLSVATIAGVIAPVIVYVAGQAHVDASTATALGTVAAAALARPAPPHVETSP